MVDSTGTNSIGAPCRRCPDFAVGSMLNQGCRESVVEKGHGVVCVPNRAEVWVVTDPVVVVEFLSWWQMQDPEAQNQLAILQNLSFDDL
eukprot:COSAG01_NODE_12407_length_1745_cov_15.771567_1_plen_89_part_00